MQNQRLFEITGEDGFFLTIIATWISVRFPYFNKKIIIDYNWPLIALLCGILGMAIVVSQLRYWMAKRSFSSATGGLLIWGLFEISLNIIYFGWIDTNYLEMIDIFTFLALGLMWAISPVICFLCNHIMKIKFENTLPNPFPLDSSE